MKRAAAFGGVLVLCAASGVAGPIERSGVQGGLVVCLDDAERLADLRLNDRYLVQGLSTDTAFVATTRSTLLEEGLHGPVSMRSFDGRQLPYVDNLVNLFVADELGAVPMSEVKRVLAPGGVALIGKKKWVQPVPDDIDEWTHFLHDSTNNAVADDHRIHSPKTLRWTAGPRWCRSHEIPSSVQGVVTSGGRLFTIFDEGPTGVVEHVPWQCRLIARDAFNGKLLWKVPLEKWDGKFGAGKGNRLNIHLTLPRRLVAKDDRVYMTLRFMNSPVSVLDAATGKILTRALPGTMHADELVLFGDTLVEITDETGSPVMNRPFVSSAVDNNIAAVDVRSG